MTVSILGEQESATTGSLSYQEDSETLALWDSLFNVVRLKGSGNEWVLPSPLQTTLLGLPTTVTEFRLTFHSALYATGTATVDVTVDTVVYTGTATYQIYKQSCAMLTNGTSLSGLSGAEGSYLCYQTEIPVGATNFGVQTFGGAGDCDLLVAYHRPDFNVLSSEGDFTQEQLQIAFPESGLWYILLAGYTSFSGVNLSMSYQTLPAPTAGFRADPTRGIVLLRVAFTDLSTGTITAWSWDFGDGLGSTEPNPTHLYTEPGVYTVRLTVTGPGGSATLTKDNLIEVNPRKSMPWLPLLLEE